MKRRRSLYARPEDRPRRAVRRGAASCRALLRSCPVTAAAGIVAASRHGLPSAADAATQARFGRPAGGRRRRGRRGCPDAGHAGSRPVRVFGPPCGRPSSSQADVRCPHVPVSTRPGVHTSGVHTTGAVRVSGRTRLRCPWPASALSEVLDAGMRRCGGQPPLGAAGSTCRRGAASGVVACPGRTREDGMVVGWR